MRAAPRAPRAGVIDADLVEMVAAREQLEFPGTVVKAFIERQDGSRITHVMAWRISRSTAWSPQAPATDRAGVSKFLGTFPFTYQFVTEARNAFLSRR